MTVSEVRLPRHRTAASISVAALGCSQTGEQGPLAGQGSGQTVKPFVATMRGLNQIIEQVCLLCRCLDQTVAVVAAGAGSFIGVAVNGAEVVVRRPG
jgi:hypothetical protein